MYSSFNESCQLCRDRDVREPCVKITAAEYDPSRVVKGPNGTCKNDYEQMFLDYIYSDRSAKKLGYWSAIFRSVASVFGHVPGHSVLLHSLLAFATLCHPNGKMSQCTYHKDLALRGLRSRSKAPGKFIDADALGAMLIALIHSTLGLRGREVRDCSIALDVFLTLYCHSQILSTSTSFSSYPVFSSIFLPVIRWVTSQYHPKVLLDRPLIQANALATNWAERCRYDLGYCRIFRIDNTVWESILTSVEDMLQMVWASLYEKVTKSSRSETSCIVCYRIELVLQDPGFQDAWESIVVSQNMPRAPFESESREIAVLGKEALDGVLMTLRTSTTASGLAALENSTVPADLLRKCLELSSLSSRRIPYLIVHYIERVRLVLGACTISASDLPKCTFSATAAKRG